MMKQQLYDLLRQCTVRVSIPGKAGHGTGFFVAPGLLLTCAHVIKAAQVENTSVEAYREGQMLPARVISVIDESDLALLRVNHPEHPCVLLDDEDALPFDDLYSYGYPDDHPSGDSATFTLEGKAGERGEQLKFKTGQVRPGFSGAPLLNIRTSRVCGLIQFTRDRQTDLGGRGIEIATALQLFPELVAQQQQFHQQDKRWASCIPERATQTRLSSDRPTSYIPLMRNPLFQPRPGEFEHLETLLLCSDATQQPVRVGLVGVTGMGGIGKTQLAVEFAYRYQDRFQAGIYWMPATGTTYFDWQGQFADLALNADYLPDDDDMSNPENEMRRARHFCRYLAAHGDALLILDNVEDPNLVLSVLPGLAGKEPACAILYTSRSTLTLPGITPHSVEILPEAAALRLLLETTRPKLLAEVIANLQNEETNAARFICQETGYLPLALVHLRGLLARDQRITLARLAEVLKQRGALDLAKTQQGDATPLFATFRLSWERIQQENARRLFKLAAYFPEATPIPLWLLGLASGLGESGDFFEPLGEALLHLKEESLLEELSGEQIRLHPLVREFGQRLMTDEGEGGMALIEEAGERLVSAFTNLNALEQRIKQQGYWGCLEQVRAARDYVELLQAGQLTALAQVERWLDRESYLLADEYGWRERLPGLFYQQLFNRSIEEEHQLRIREAPSRWIQQIGQVGLEDRSLLRVFAGHILVVQSVAFSPDGTKILTGSNDRTARLWETESGRLLATFTGHTSGVRSVAFSPNGTNVLTGSTDRTARLWETVNGRLLTTFTGHTGEVESAVFSPDGTQVLTGSADRTARLWERESGRLLSTLAGHTGGLRSVAFSPDGTQVLTGSADRTARLWERESGNLIAMLKDHKGGVRSVVFSPDGTQVLTGSSDWIVRLWDIVGGRVLAQLVGHAGRVMSVAFSPDGKQILTGSEDQTARLWETASGNLIALQVGHSGRIRSVAFSPNGMQILTGSTDRTARLWKVTNEQLPPKLEGHTSDVRSVAFSPDGTRVLTGSDDQTARLWETDSGNLLVTLKGHKGRVIGVSYSPDGLGVITSSSDRMARLWETESGKLIVTLKGHTDRVRSAAFSPDGTRVLTGSDDRTARLWDAANGELLATLEGHTEGIWSVVFSPDGMWLLTGSDDQTVRLWEAASSTLLATFEGHVGGVRSMAFSPDGTKILIGSVNGTALLWELESCKLLATLDSHAGDVGSVIFFPDESLVITCDQRGQVFFWRSNGEEMGSLLGIYAAIYEVGAMYWQDAKTIVLADKGGPRGRPHFYHLKLHGME